MNRMYKTSALVALLIGSVPALGAAAPAAGWVADLGAGSGKVEFTATGKPSALKIHGQGDAPKGRLTVDGTRVKGQIAFKLDSLDSGIGMRDKHMKEKYLETSKYPEAKLEIAKLELPNGLPDGDFQMADVPFEGPLTLHGKTHDVKGTAKIARAGGKVQIDANFGLKISDYAIDLPTFAGITVADEVNVAVHSEAVAGS